MFVVQRAWPAPASIRAKFSIFSKAAPLTSTSSSSSRPAASPDSPRQHFVLEYDYAAANLDELKVKRTPLRSAHLAHAERARAQGQLLLGGAFAEGTMGGLLVFGGAPAVTRKQVEEFAAHDPYVVGKLVSGWRVREWTVVLDAMSRPELK